MAAMTDSLLATTQATSIYTVLVYYKKMTRNTVSHDTFYSFLHDDDDI
jgi:hypothetical protein